MHPEHASRRESDERVAHELRPADDEDQLGLEPANRLDRRPGVDVTRLDELRTELCRDLVERALTGTARVDGALEVTTPTTLQPDSAAATRQSRPIVSKLTQTVRIATRC